MRKLSVFNQVSVDGYFRTPDGDVSWTHQHEHDAEMDAFVAGNARGGGALVFGRKTYEMMAAFWPTPAAAQQFPAVAEGMNRMPKIVFSRSMKKAAWQNTTIVAGDTAAEMRRLKEQPGDPMVILGSGSLVAPLARAGLVDELQLLVYPIVLGGGVSMFDGIGGRVGLKLRSTRTFGNGVASLVYGPA